jgi:hypothetical protein
MPQFVSEWFARVAGFSTWAMSSMELSIYKRGKKDDMLTRVTTLLAAALLCFAAAALAQTPAASSVQHNQYSTARETKLQGKVVSYSAQSNSARSGATLSLQTSSGVVNVHLGNAHLLSSRNVTLNAGDAVTITGENVAFGNQTIFAARVLQKGNITVTLRSKTGQTLVITPRSEGGVQSAPAGAR